MAKYGNSKVLPTILVVVIIIIVIVALISGARAIFFSGSPSTNQAVTDTTVDSLLSTDISSSVSMSVRGPIVADEDFNSYRIVVSPTSRQVTTYTGYLRTVIEQQTLGNNTAAYDQFVNALNLAKMTAGDQPAAEEKNDVRGICATGNLSEFSILKNDTSIETLWTSTCSGSQGTLRANENQLSALFVAQIPEAKTLIRGVSL